MRHDGRCISSRDDPRTRERCPLAASTARSASRRGLQRRLRALRSVRERVSLRHPQACRHAVSRSRWNALLHAAGVAVVDPNSCLSWQGLRCEVCFRECPENGRALTIEVRPRGLSRHAVFVPVIHPDACTGCGLCEKACPTDEAAIRVADPSSVLGTIGSHYRLGWLSEEDPKNMRREGPPATPDAASSEGNAAKAPATAPGMDYLNSEEPL